MIAILIIFTYFMLMLNFDAPLLVSNTSNFLLTIEHTIVLITCFKIIRNNISNKKTRNLFYITFLVGYSFSLLFLTTVWTPNLIEQFTTEWGAFDPIKYYSMAAVAINHGVFVDTFEFFPIAYIYWGIMKIFGLNPLIPLFFNQIIFVYSITIITNYINTNTQQNTKYYCWLLLIQELIYYNITASKDILCAYCATIIFVKSNELFNKSYNLKSLALLFIFIAIFFIARFSVAIVSILGIISMYLSINKLTSKKIIMIVCLSLSFIFILSKTSILGEYFNITQLINKVSSELSGVLSVAAELHDVNKNGFSQKIIPTNTFEFIIFGFIRSICYLIIDGRFIHNPIPILTFNQTNPLLSTVDFTTLLMFISCLFILKWCRNIKNENHNIKMLLYIFVLYWYVVGTFNPLMIHIRYRLVYDIFFFCIAIKAYIYIKHNKQEILNKA